MQTSLLAVPLAEPPAGPDLNSVSTLLADAREIFRLQSSVIAELANRVDETFVRAIDTILSSRGHLVVSGIGKSGLVGNKIAATLTSTGTPSLFLHPAEAFHGDLGMITGADVGLLISNSGETEEIVRLVPTLRKLGIPLIGLLGNARSKLWREVDFPLDVSVTREACPFNLAPTNSTLATLAMGDALAVSLMRARNFRPIDFARFHPGGTLGRKLLSRVRDAMRTKALPLLRRQDTVGESLVTIAEGKLGIGVVVDEDSRVLGLVTDGDLRRALQKHRDLLSLRIQDIMTPDPITIRPDASLEEAEACMQSLKLKSLLVVDEVTRLVGVLDIFEQ